LSTVVMAACWPLQMPPSAKAVLISLADNANDDGYCYPSIPYICDRTCLGRTAVIDAIKWLEAHGALIADRSSGRHTTYTVTPKAYRNQSASRTSPPSEPVRQTDKTSPPAGLHPSAKRTLTVIEPSKNRQRGEAHACPADVDPGHWRDWLAARKAKRAGMVTETVMAGMQREAAKAGIPLAEAIRVCAERSWAGFNAAWDWQPTARNAGPPGRGGMTDEAIARLQAELEAEERNATA
jgi:hypothetical protein